jgi:hypothetical protein
MYAASGLTTDLSACSANILVLAPNLTASATADTIEMIPKLERNPGRGIV